MKSLKTSVRQSAFIWLISLLLVIAAFMFLYREEKAAGFLKLVPFHRKGWDVFFTWFTYLGDGIFILLLSVWLIVKKQKWKGIGIIISYALSGLVAQIIKNVHAAPRPAVYFRETGRPFYTIPDVTLLQSHASFPSGHTASVFALVTTIILFAPKSKWNILWWSLAVAVAYSRMYLGNHFLEDVTVGAIIGIVTAFATYAWLYRFVQKKDPAFIVHP